MAEKMKHLKPLFNRILVRKADSVTQTKTGLHIPEQKKSDYYKATVMAVGPGGQNRDGDVVPCCLKVGDEVLLPDFGGTPIKLSENDDQYFIYREPDILAKVSE